MSPWRVREFGGPKEVVLRFDEVPPLVAGPDELVIRVVATLVSPHW